MSGRKTVSTVVIQPCDGGVSPNAYVPVITADVRVIFPPNTVSLAEVEEALDKAIAQVREELSQRSWYR